MEKQYTNLLYSPTTWSHTDTFLHVFYDFLLKTLYVVKATKKQACRAHHNAHLVSGTMWIIF